MKQPGEEKNMYSIEFYEKENGESDVWDFLEELREKAATNKDARIQYRQITLYILNFFKTTERGNRTISQSI